MNDNHMEDLLKENRKKGRSPYLLNTLTKVILGKMMSRICFNMLQKKKKPWNTTGCEWSLLRLNDKYKEGVIILFCICEFYLFFTVSFFGYVKFATRKQINKLWIHLPESHTYAPTFTLNFKEWAHGIRCRIFRLTKHPFPPGQDSFGKWFRCCGCGQPSGQTLRSLGFSHSALGENFPG